MKAIQLTEALYSYVAAHCPEVNAALPALRAETAKLPRAAMQISPVQGSLMHLLTRLVGARRVLEVGCFTGYSAICMAQGLAPGGKLVTLDVDPVTAAIAKRYFAASGLEDRIELRLGDARESLRALETELGAHAFDLMFIDADKLGMLAYYEAGLRLVRPGGLIIADNVLWSGAVADPDDTSPDTVAIRRFNDVVQHDERVDRSMINVSDGLYLLRRR